MSDIRYGIFLRPDPATCWAVTQVTSALKQQYGLVSAAAFAPHATLIGNLKTKASEAELISTLEEVFQKQKPLPVYNLGLERRESDAFVYNIDRDSTGANRNEALAEVAAKVKAAVLPLSVPHTDYLVPSVAEYQFDAHLSLANFELTIDNRLAEEVGEFIAGLPIVPPASFVARWYTLFELRADWDGRWWENQPWKHIISWQAQDH